MISATMAQTFALPTSIAVRRFCCSFPMALWLRLAGRFRLRRRRCGWRRRRGCARIGIDDDLAVEAQVDRLQFLVLRPPLFGVRDVGLVAFEEVRRAEVQQ